MESDALSLLKEAGKTGLLLTELAKQLEKSTTAILKVVEPLANNGRIKKVEEQHDGNSVLRFIWQDDDKAEWDTLQGCPCFSCPEIDQCGAGQPTSPCFCKKLDTWLQTGQE